MPQRAMEMTAREPDYIDEFPISEDSIRNRDPFGAPSKLPGPEELSADYEKQLLGIVQGEDSAEKTQVLTHVKDEISPADLRGIDRASRRYAEVSRSIPQMRTIQNYVTPEELSDPTQPFSLHNRKLFEFLGVFWPGRYEPN